MTEDKKADIDVLIDQAKELLEDKGAIFQMLKQNGHASSIVETETLRLTMFLELKPIDKGEDK